MKVKVKIDWMKVKVTSTSCHESVPQVPIIGFVFCSTITWIHSLFDIITITTIITTINIFIIIIIVLLASRYPGKTFLGGYFGSVVPHSVLLSTSSNVYIDLKSRSIFMIIMIIMILMMISD